MKLLNFYVLISSSDDESNCISGRVFVCFNGEEAFKIDFCFGLLKELHSSASFISRRGEAGNCATEMTLASCLISEYDRDLS